MDYFTIDGILDKKLIEFIGTWNMVLMLKGDWYQIPFTDLDYEFPDRKWRFKGLNPIEANALIDEIAAELLVNWDYFEPLIWHCRLESSKLRMRR